MLPLKAFVNALQNTLRYPDCFVRASPFLGGRWEHYHARFVLEKPSDRFDIELPEFRHFRRRVVALVRSGRFGRRARIRERSGHGYLSPLSRSASDFETRSQAFEACCRVSLGTLLSLSGAGLGG
jgi:hypothetical protein